MSRRYLILLGAVLILMLLVAPAGAKAFPEIIPLPTGFRPEGVVVGRGPVIYAGSLADGAIYQADLRSGSGSILVPGEAGRIAVGLAFERSSNVLWVSGGPTGTATVYDAGTGAELAAYSFAGSGFVNDVTLTKDAAYFTDSFVPVLYRVDLASGEQETIALGPDFSFVPGAFNANGIVATAGDQWLIVANSQAQAVYLVDPVTGEATEIQLDSDLPNVDGLVLVGHTLYAVQNQINQISVIRLSGDYRSGDVVDVLSSDAFRVPTTADKFGSWLYAVNARFGVAQPDQQEYEIVRVSR